VLVPSLFPATGEAEVSGSWPEASLDKVSARPYLKNKVKAKRLGWGVVEGVGGTRGGGGGGGEGDRQLSRMVEHLLRKPKALSATKERNRV
jgi:hypothetical protein